MLKGLVWRRIHIKMLVGDYLTYETKSKRSGGSSICRACEDSSSSEDLTHILVVCVAYEDIRNRIFSEFSDACSELKINLKFEEIARTNENLCQFILDPSSLNLQKLINICDPILDRILRISRDYCFAINSARMKILSKKKI